MRHRVVGRKLSRHSQHRKLMFRNMLVSLITYGRIRTTLAKAKEIKRLADKIVTLGKKDTLHARRQAFAILRNETVVKKLFTEIAPRFKDRAGGYTRVYKLGWRRGDAAPLSLVEFVGEPLKEEKKTKLTKRARNGAKRVTRKRKEAASDSENQGEGR